jgi:hypothetical protein
MTASDQKFKGIARQIRGWLAAVLGVILILFGLLVLFSEALSALPNWYEGTLLCTLPSWVVGIPLLIFGIRWIKNLVPKARTESDIFARTHKTHLIWSWVFAIAGGLLTLSGIATLYMTVVIIYPSDWDIGYFIFCLICWLIGIPLLTVGIRRLKQSPEYKNVNWGWVAMIAGGLLAAGAVYLILLYIFVDRTNQFGAWLEMIAPLFVVGIPILILGIRRMERVNFDVDSPETLQPRTKKRLIWGWVLAILGGSTIIGSLIFLIYRYDQLIIQAPLEGYVEPYQGYLVELLMALILILILPLVVAGISLLISAAILLKKAPITRQSRGWLLLLIAVLFLFTVMVALSYEMNRTFTLVVYTGIYSSLFLIAGLVCFFFGIRDVRHEETPLITPGI